MEAIASRLEAIATSNKKLLVTRCIATSNKKLGRLDEIAQTRIDWAGPLARTERVTSDGPVFHATAGTDGT